MGFLTYVTHAYDCDDVGARIDVSPSAPPQRGISPAWRRLKSSTGWGSRRTAQLKAYLRPLRVFVLFVLCRCSSRAARTTCNKCPKKEHDWDPQKDGTVRLPQTEGAQVLPTQPIPCVKHAVKYFLSVGNARLFIPGLILAEAPHSQSQERALRLTTTTTCSWSITPLPTADSCPERPRNRQGPSPLHGASSSLRVFRRL